MAAYAVYGLGLAEIAVLIYFAQMDSAGADSGGREMALFFFILLPLAFILAGLAAFRFGKGWVVRGIGMTLILLPSAAGCLIWLG